MKSVTTTNPLQRKENMENKLALAGSTTLFFFFFWETVRCIYKGEEQRRYSVENARRHGLLLVGKAVGFNCVYCLGFSPSEKTPVWSHTVFTTHIYILLPEAQGRQTTGIFLSISIWKSIWLKRLLKQEISIDPWIFLKSKYRVFELQCCPKNASKRKFISTLSKVLPETQRY